MNDIWSSKLQGINTLDISRELRFRDDRKDLILYILGLKKGMTIAEIGCGTGALARKLAHWLGNETKITGVDRDTNFIEFASEKAKSKKLSNLTFVEGDALSIPFPDYSFDASISHTLIEHVPNKEFLVEQKRICREGGRVSVMITIGNKTIISSPPETPFQTEREVELMKPFKPYFEDADKLYLKKYWSGYDGLPRIFDSLGFKDIQVDSISLPVVVDDSRNNIETKKLIIEEQQRSLYLDKIEMGLGMMKNKLPDSHINELKSLIDDRFYKRWNLVLENKKIWDYKISNVLIVSGVK